MSLALYVAAALIAACIILLCAIVADGAWSLATELGNSLHVACTGFSGRSGRHVARGYGYPPRHRTHAAVTL